MHPYFYPVYPVSYIPMVKYAKDPTLWDKLTPYAPYFQAAGVGAGLGALGGAGIGAWRGGDWKKALKSALIGMVTGAIAAPAVYAGYSRLFPGQTAPPAQGTPPVQEKQPDQSETPAEAPSDQTGMFVPGVPLSPWRTPWAIG